MSCVDLLIIGGGINGVGIARDAAGRGLSVILCEQGDLGSGTSQASSKLIHGGLRYLEHGAFGLVRDSLAERAILQRIAPHLVQPLPFILPHQPGLRPYWQLRLGLALYGALCRASSLPCSSTVTLAGTSFGVGLRRDLTRGFRYWDCQTFDARLVVANAIDAGERGAVILPRTRCVHATPDGPLWRVRLRSNPPQHQQPNAPMGDAKEGADTDVRARMLVNAAGPWVDQIAIHGVMGSGAMPGRVRLIKGSHIVVPRRPGLDHALILQNTDGRVVFVLPYEDRFSLIGTTDVPYVGDPGAATVSNEEVEYLCEAANRALESRVSPGEIVDRFAGVRALCDDGRSNPARIRRDSVLESRVTAGGASLVTVSGGKLTSYRRLAERVLARLVPNSAPWTATEALPGGYGAAVLPGWLPAPMARRLGRYYGSRAATLLGRARSMADLGTDFGGGLTEREVIWLVDREYARTASDILWRRTKMGLVLSPTERAALSRWLAVRDKA